MAVPIERCDAKNTRPKPAPDLLIIPARLPLNTTTGKKAPSGWVLYGSRYHHALLTGLELNKEPYNKSFSHTDIFLQEFCLE